MKQLAPLYLNCSGQPVSLHDLNMGLMRVSGSLRGVSALIDHLIVHYHNENEVDDLLDVSQSALKLMRDLIDEKLYPHEFLCPEEVPHV